MLLDNIPHVLPCSIATGGIGTNQKRAVCRPTDRGNSDTLWPDIVRPGHMPRCARLVTACCRAGVIHWEGWMPHHGEVEPDSINALAMPIQYRCRLNRWYFIMTRDLTELKRTEQRLAER